MNIDQTTIIEEATDYFLRYWTGPTRPGLRIIRSHVHVLMTRAENEGKLSWQTSNRWNTYSMAMAVNKRLRERKKHRTAASVQDEIERRAMTG